MSTVFPVSAYDSEAVKLTNTSKTDILTVPAGFWYELIAIRICASGGATETATIHWFDASLATEYVLNDAIAIAPGLPGDEECFPLHMEAGDILRVTGHNNEHVFVSFLKGSDQPQPAKA